MGVYSMIEHRVILQVIYKVPWSEEEKTCEIIRQDGYRVAYVTHEEEYVRLIGEKMLIEKRKK